MDSITFRKSRSRTRRNLDDVMSRVRWTLILFFMGLAFLYAFDKFMRKNELAGWALVGLLVIVLFHVAGIFLGPLFVAPKRNFLRLDRDGLTYVNEGKSRHWPWPELSAFKFKACQANGETRILQGAMDDQERADTPWRPRQGAYAAALSEQGDVCVIQDIYDTPLDEITAKLNDYRARTAAPGQA